VTIDIADFKFQIADSLTNLNVNLESAL